MDQHMVVGILQVGIVGTAGIVDTAGIQVGQTDSTAVAETAEDILEVVDSLGSVDQ